jgi:hypothetical protein
MGFSAPEAAESCSRVLYNQQQRFRLGELLEAAEVSLPHNHCEPEPLRAMLQMLIALLSFSIILRIALIQRHSEQTTEGDGENAEVIGERKWKWRCCSNTT